MKLLAAPVIHARTRDNDFPSSLLVIPEDFSPETASWARRYIVASTGWLELTTDAGRRVVFCDKERIVSGLSIRISNLCQLCGTDDSSYVNINVTRINYAFIGLVFSKAEAAEKCFDLPFSLFLNLYEQYIALRWEEPFVEDGLTALKVPYAEFEVPEQTETCELPLVQPSDPRLVIDAGVADENVLAAAVTAQMQTIDEYSFCSNLPNTKSVTESQFRVVTSPHAQTVVNSLRKKECEKRKEQQKQAKEEKLERKLRWDNPSLFGGRLSGLLHGFGWESVHTQEKPASAKKEETNIRIIKYIGSFVLFVIGSLLIFMPSKDSKLPKTLKIRGEWTDDDEH